MSEMLQGLMQDDFPLTLQHIRRGLRTVSPDSTVTSLREPGVVESSTFAELHGRIDRLARVLTRLGVEQGERVGTFAWNNQRHLELYFAVPCLGAVLHTLNIRLFAEQLTYIVNHAEDRVVFVDASLVPVLEPLAASFQTVERYVVMGEGELGGLPNALRYDELLEEAGPGDFDYPELDERQAAALCYTSGTTGNPKGVLYSHRSVSLHSTATLVQGRPRPRTRRPRARGRADVPRQRLGPATRGRARRRRFDPARPLPLGRATGRPDRLRAPNPDGLRADDLCRPAALRRRAP